MRRPITLAALLLAGCQYPVQFTDDVDFEFDFEPFFLDFDGDTLHTPYVRGAPVTVYAHPRVGVDADALAVDVEDPEVFEILSVSQDEDGDLAIQGVARGAGETELVVTRRGEAFDSVPISVGFPTRTELHAAGPLFVDLDDATDGARILAGGLATFQVQYFDGDERLWGNSALSVTEAQGLDLSSVEQTWLFENREWLQVSGSTPGAASVALSVDGDPVGPATFEIVEAAAVSRVEIHGSDERGARDGDWRVLLAQSFDTGDRPIYGIDYAWEIDGVVQAGQGDLYRYEFERGAGSDVRASFGDQDAFATANIGGGYVDSSNNLGCDAATGAGLGSLAWLLALGATRRASRGAGGERGPR